MKLVAILILPILALAGWRAGAREDAPCAKKLDLECVKKLAGTWMEADAKGQPTDTRAAVYQVTAGGHAVLETIFPGTEHEMISVHYQDGEDLVLTHYCMLGNHPRMKASLDATTGEVVYTCSGAGANFKACADVEHMHEGRIKLEDEDRIRSRWTAWAGGKPSPDGALEFTFVRKR